MPVESSRHYRGPGLGEVGMWACPSCGAENAGPLAGGCLVCGAGKPGQQVEAPPPPPAPPTSVPGDAAGSWWERHPDATLEQAFTAGYIEGMRDAMRKQAEVAHQRQALSPEGKLHRTILAALALFRDQVLAADPEEVTSGEWLSAAEVTAFITQLSQQQGVTHG